MRNGLYFFNCNEKLKTFFSFDMKRTEQKPGKDPWNDSKETNVSRIRLIDEVDASNHHSYVGPREQNATLYKRSLRETLH